MRRLHPSACFTTLGLVLLLAACQQPAPPPAAAPPAAPTKPVTPMTPPCTTMEGGDNKGMGDPNSRWPAGTTLRVFFMDGEADLQKKALKAAQEWSQYGNIFFKRVETTPADIRVSFVGTGHWSRIGTDANNYNQSRSTMNLQRSVMLDRQGRLWDSEIRRVALHEFGHAIGILHEHLRPSASNPIIIDEAKLIKFYKDGQGWSEEEVRFNVIDRYKESQVTLTDYDAFSVMHYPIPSSCAHMNPAWKGKLPTAPNGYLIGWNSPLSPGDIGFVRAFYPKS